MRCFVIGSIMTECLNLNLDQPFTAVQEHYEEEYSFFHLSQTKEITITSLYLYAIWCTSIKRCYACTSTRIHR